jgi:hypothetical protein
MRYWPMICTPLVVASLALPAVCVSDGKGAFAASNSIGQTMPLRDEGMLFVNGQLVLSNFFGHNRASRNR